MSLDVGGCQTAIRGECLQVDLAAEQPIDLAVGSLLAHGRAVAGPLVDGGLNRLGRQAGVLLDELVFGAGVRAHVLAFGQTDNCAVLDLGRTVSKGIPLKITLSRCFTHFFHMPLLTKEG